MTSLKQLAKYCRDYIDLISPSLLSRQAKQIIIPRDILDATPLYKRVSEVDYETLALALNLEPQLDQLDTDTENEETDEVSEGDDERRKLEIAKALDDIYRKYETSSYTKQITLRFGRVSFSAEPLIDEVDEVSEGDGKYKDAEQHLFSVPITIKYQDYSGARHYSLVIDDSLITTNASFLNEYLPQEDRDELFRFIAQSEAEELTSIPLSPAYVDELWAKITHYLQQADAKNISSEPDMDNVLVILLPKVNYFLSQDLLGIIDAAEDEEMLDTSLSAWVDDRDMSVNVETSDDGGQELFFPFPYDNSQLRVLGKLGNRAAVVEGPPGTGKSQTIANILCHLAATGKKVLFVSQKDQAVRGVKDKLKTLDIPYLFGYLPDRSSRLHSEEDEKDSAANALKGIAQALYSTGLDNDPKEALVKLHEYKPKFDASINDERKYFELYNEWSSLDAYDFGNNAPRLTQEWYEELIKLQKSVQESQLQANELEQKQTKVHDQMSKLEKSIQLTVAKSAALSKQFADKTKYPWISGEHELLRGLSFASVAKMMNELMQNFEAHANDRKSNFLKSKLRTMKLSKELDHSIEALPREMYESIKSVVFGEESKTQRFMHLKGIYTYFITKDKLLESQGKLEDEVKNSTQILSAVAKEIQSINQSLKEYSAQITATQLDDSDMNRVHKLIAESNSVAFENIKRRYELQQQLNDYKILNPNMINEEIMREKSSYKVMIRDYVKNQLARKVNDYRQVKQYRAALESIGRKLGKTKKAYKTFDSLKSNPFNFEAMSEIIPIWMMGLDDASRVLPLAQNIFDYVIIDEASQCNISYVLPAMYRAKHTIFFGDTLQMRDATTAFKSNQQLEALANKHKIPEDLQIKATEDSVKSVMDIAKLNGFETTPLRYHYRSPKELIGFSNQWFYEPHGRTLQVVNDDILAMDDGRVMKNHVVVPNPEIELSDKTNLTEAYYIKELIAKIKADERTQDKSIAVLSFFNEQAELLRRVITDEEIKISVIEGIQGDERDIVIYSFVIKSPQEKRRYGSLTGEGGEIRKEVSEGRVNVAFSRARLQVHAVTSIPPNLWPDGIWIKRYLEYIETNGRVNRLVKNEQHFDSKFEENVYDFLFGKLDPVKYTLTTQVESCGFKIDLVIGNIDSGKKLAIECDGPTHFEHGDGQVRVADDYERQFVLETAGWRFYRILYSSWLSNEAKERQELFDYILKYMKQAKATTEDNKINDEPEYVPLNVEVPKDFIESLKADMQATPARSFGRKPTKIMPAEDNKKEIRVTSEGQQTNLDVQHEPHPEVKPAVVVAKKRKPIANKTNSAFREIAELILSPRRSIVISSKADNSIWVNEKLTTDTFTGFTSKGFGLSTKELPEFIAALSEAINSTNFEKDFTVSSSLKLVVHNPDVDTVDIRYYKTSDGYTGYIKKGIRVVKASAVKLRDELQKIT